ncbi:MAG: carbohydrate kinase [Kiritimatiellia bacterium]|nr:carbohydrate kinase [Kiritimatiellia bacterium]
MIKNKKFVVVGIGEILWDMLPAGKQLGGAPANFAYFAKALGAEAYMVSSVGGDPLGREILDKLGKLGFSRKYVAVDQAHATGVVGVRLDKDGQPSYAIKRNVAWDFLRFSSKLRSLAGKTKAVCFGSLAQRSAVTRRTIREFVAAMPASSLKVFDINLRQSFYTRKIIEQLLKLSNVFKLNDEELVIVSDLLSIRGGAAKAVKSLMLKYKLKVVAVTKGPKGAVLYCPEGVYPAEGRKIRTADTVGAGDAFTAALVMGLLNGLKMEIIVELANRLAAYVCGRPGATPVLSPGMIKTMKAIVQPFNDNSTAKI